MLLLFKAWPAPPRTAPLRAVPPLGQHDKPLTLLRRSCRPLACLAAPRGSEADNPRLLTEARKFFEDHGVTLSRAYLAQAGSRTTSRIAVRATSSGITIGMFKPGTHDVLPWNEDERCYLPQHPAINAAVDAIAHQLEAFGGLSAYDEARHYGTLRYLQLSVERSSERVQVTLVANVAALADDPALERFAAHLWALHGDTAGGESGALCLHSIWVNLNPTRLNNILSYEDGAWKLLFSGGCASGSEVTGEMGVGAGSEVGRSHAEEGHDLDGSLIERLPSGAAFVLPPYVFRQANMEGFDGIVASVRSAVHPGARVVEWYAGVGVLGLSLAPSCAWVRCSDVNPPKAAFEASRSLLDPDVQTRVSYQVGSAAERIEDARGADVAVVDPPRKGLDAALLEALCESPSLTNGVEPDRVSSSSLSSSACAELRTLVYVSCGFPALAQDADRLFNAGWRVRKNEATAHVLFTGANHIETVVVFDRDVRTQHALQADGEAKQGLTAAVQAPRRREGSTSDRGAPRKKRDTSTPRGRRLAARRRKREDPDA